MFSSKEYLQKKTGPWGIGRFSYLQSLVTEFQDTSSEESKEQVLANLANFAYDPINYDFMRKLNVWDLFLDCLTESNPKLVEFAIGGICNCSLDKDNRDHILKNDGVKLVVGCLSSDNEETVLSAITCLMFLFTQESREEVASLPVVECMLRFRILFWRSDSGSHAISRTSAAAATFTSPNLMLADRLVSHSELSSRTYTLDQRKVPPNFMFTYAAGTGGLRKVQNRCSFHPGHYNLSLLLEASSALEDIAGHKSHLSSPNGSGGTKKTALKSKSQSSSGGSSSSPARQTQKTINNNVPAGKSRSPITGSKLTTPSPRTQQTHSARTTATPLTKPKSQPSAQPTKKK